MAVVFSTVSADTSSVDLGGIAWSFLGVSAGVPICGLISSLESGVAVLIAGTPLYVC